MAKFMSIKDYMDKKNNELRLYIPFKAVYENDNIEDALMKQYEMADKVSKVYGGMNPMLSLGCFAFDSYDKARFAADFCGARAILTMTIKKKVKGLSCDEVFWVPYVNDVSDDTIEKAKRDKDDISYYRLRRINWFKTDADKLGIKFEITLINVDKETIRMGYVNGDNGKVIHIGQYDESLFDAITSAYPKKHICQRRLISRRK